ncbi:MAG: hypothetical protein D6725_14045 [Planctomycetota bacterium]|nr:MAG: hypothetical protein D6725_14045 [Planctomycetota bacterium]
MSIFRKRILPIARSNQASSCTECHFAGVDLRNFVTDDPAATFAALRDRGWIDPQRPGDSKLLRLIARKPEHEDPLMARVRAAEYAAFRDWIRAASADPAFRSAPPTRLEVGIELPPEVIRHARKDRVLQTLVDTIWTEMGRCVSCHSPDRNQRLVRKYGPRVSWFRPHDPEGTLRVWVEHGLIDEEHPEKSLLLLKPLAQEVEHGGGPKFVAGSRTDKLFRRFLDDYAAVVTGRYRRAADLPSPLREIQRPTGQHLRIVGLPAEWNRKLMRVDLYRWLGDRWSAERWATADNPVVGPKRMWQSVVMACAPRDSERGRTLRKTETATLPPGRYLARIYVDRHGRTQHHRDYELGRDDLVAELIVQGPWPPGYRPPKIVHFHAHD